MLRSAEVQSKEEEYLETGIDAHNIFKHLKCLCMFSTFMSERIFFNVRKHHDRFILDGSKTIYNAIGGN